MLCWQIWNQCKGLSVRPSELYNIQWPLACFFFDRGIYWWGTHVEEKLNEAENRVRTQMKNRKGSDAFATSARIATFNKIFGLSVASAYRQPQVVKAEKPVEKVNPKAGQHNTDLFSG